MFEAFVVSLEPQPGASRSISLQFFLHRLHHLCWLLASGWPQALLYIRFPPRTRGLPPPLLTSFLISDQSFASRGILPFEMADSWLICGVWPSRNTVLGPALSRRELFPLRSTLARSLSRSCSLSLSVSLSACHRANMSLTRFRGGALESFWIVLTALFIWLQIGENSLPFLPDSSLQMNSLPFLSGCRHLVDYSCICFISFWMDLRSGSSISLQDVKILASSDLSAFGTSAKTLRGGIPF